MSAIVRALRSMPSASPLAIPLGLLLTLALAVAAVSLPACLGTETPATKASRTGGMEETVAGDLGTPAHYDRVMTSAFCGSCHPAIYAEHRQNTHGRAFFDEEARLATRGFRREDCVRCHTPRPVFETGIGMTPMQRWTNLEEGNTCMSCHGRAGYDYASFTGGVQCRDAFEPRVGSVQDCATCHRIAGTPDQWSRAEHGQLAGRVCIDCHMPRVLRPVALGETPRMVRSHVFPASSNESQLRRAYAYSAEIVGNEVVVRITNRGTGHNFPTANRQRAVESLVIVRDAEGTEVARSRMVCHYPYAAEFEPHQLTPPQSSQIPSGKTTEHRVPLQVPAGVVECQLYFKLYRPIADSEPRLSRCLEERRLGFEGITPSTQPVDESPEVRYPAAPTSMNDFLDPAGYANVVRTDRAGAVEIPSGDSAEDIAVLAALLESHLPEARRRARERLADLYPASAPALVEALARWSNETFNEAKRTFVAIGAPAVPALTDALRHEHLYVRCHARQLLARLGFEGDRAAIRTELVRALRMENPLDRRSAAQALGAFGDETAAADLRPLLDDGDPDVVAAAAGAFAQLGDRGGVDSIEAALARARWPETRRDLAVALASLGSAAGVPALLDQLDQDDELQREYAFAALASITGTHLGYEAGAPRSERLKAIARLSAHFAKSGADVHAPHRVAPEVQERTWDLVEMLGGGTDTRSGGDDEEIMAELLAYGTDAVPALIEGLTFPSGYSDKRALVCQALGRIGSKEAAPFLAAALRDPVPSVTEWACWALEGVGDPETLAQIRDYEDRIPSLVGAERRGGDESTDKLLARAARTRWMLGDESARDELIGLLLSDSVRARLLAIDALKEKYGDDRGYDWAAGPAARVAMWARWADEGAKASR